MKSKFQSFFHILLEPENLITLVGVAIASLLGYSSVKNNDTMSALNAILTVVGALAISQIITSVENAKSRKKIETMEGKLANLSQLSNPLIRLRKDVESLQNSVKEASDIFVIAHTATIVLRQTEFFVDCIKRGAKIRFALANNENIDLLRALSRATDMSIESYLADLKSAAAILNLIRKQAPNPEHLQARVLDHFSTLSILAVDLNSPSGKMFVEMIPFKSSPYLRPHLFVSAKNNPEWFMYFRDLCELIWRNSEESHFF